MKYCKIFGLILVIILAIGITIHIYNSGRIIEVEMSVGDTYAIVNVVPDDDIDMSDLSGNITYTVTRMGENGLTDFTITAEKAGKETIKVEDAHGNKYKYKIRISSK